MTSSLTEFESEELFELDEKSEAVANFVTLVGSQIQDAFLQRKIEEGLTQQGLASLLGVDRSRVHRCLSGYSNLTLESVAALAWALRAAPMFSLVMEEDAARNCNHFTSPRPAVGNSATMPRVAAPPVVRTSNADTRVNRVELAD